MINQKGQNNGNHHLKEAIPNGKQQTRQATARCKIKEEVLTQMKTMKRFTKVHSKEEKLNLKDLIG